MRVSPVSPSPDQRPPEDAGRRDDPNTLRIRDLGDEVHLWVEQRVPWTVALKIMKLLKDPDPLGRGEDQGRPLKRVVSKKGSAVDPHEP